MTRLCDIYINIEILSFSLYNNHSFFACFHYFFFFLDNWRTNSKNKQKSRMNNWSSRYEIDTEIHIKGKFKFVHHREGRRKKKFISNPGEWQVAHRRRRQRPRHSRIRRRLSWLRPCSGICSSLKASRIQTTAFLAIRSFPRRRP